MKDDAFLSAIRLLCGDDAPRVWSLIVTIFGDLAQREGDTVSGPVLGALLSPVGVRPEAMRVALHRLRNEGWIETHKRGREAFHALSAMGLAQSAGASKKIYASEHPAGPNWHLLCFPQTLANDEQVRANSLKKDNYVAVAAGVYLANGSALEDVKDALVVQGSIGAVPDWLSNALAPQDMRAAFKELSDALQLVALETASDMSPLQIATLRALIVHRWRKLVLRLPNVPDVLFGSAFEGVQCREQVLSALELLPRPELSTLLRSAL